MLFRSLSEIRQIAFTDLDKALLMILSDTLTYLTAGGGEIDVMTKKAYEYYQAKAEKQNK